MRPEQRCRAARRCLLAAVLAAAPACTDAAVNVGWRPVADLNAALPPAVRVFAGTDPATPLRAWYVSIAAGAAAAQVRVLVSDDPQDRRETPSRFAADTGACVVVNGGYFTMERTPAQHVGLLVVDGAIVTPAAASVGRDGVRYELARAALGISATGFDIAWATSRNDRLQAWPAPPAHRPGSPAQLDEAAAAPWLVDDALGAGPALVVAGQVDVTTDEEVFFGTAIPFTHPRTAAGIAADGTLLLLVVDGRQQSSRGVTLAQLAAMMLGIGAREAVNLDGGGSSSLVVNGRLLNKPAGRVREREVMSAIGVFCGAGA